MTYKLTTLSNVNTEDHLVHLLSSCVSSPVCMKSLNRCKHHKNTMGENLLSDPVWLRSVDKKKKMLNFLGNTFYPAFSFIASIALLRFRLVKSSAKLIMYVDTQTMQKSSRTKARIDARQSEPTTDTQEEKTKNNAALLDSECPKQRQKKTLSVHQ